MMFRQCLHNTCMHGSINIRLFSNRQLLFSFINHWRGPEQSRLFLVGFANEGLFASWSCNPIWSEPSVQIAYHCDYVFVSPRLPNCIQHFQFDLKCRLYSEVKGSPPSMSCPILSVICIPRFISPLKQFVGQEMCQLERRLNYYRTYHLQVWTFMTDRIPIKAGV